MRYHPLGNGRFFMRMDPDDEIIGALRQLLSQEGITAGLVRGVGWAQSLTLGFLTPDIGGIQRVCGGVGHDACRISGFWRGHGGR